MVPPQEKFTIPVTAGSQGQVMVADGSDALVWDNLGYEVGDWAQGNGPFSGEMNTSVIIPCLVAIGDDGSDYAAFICSNLLRNSFDRYQSFSF